MVAAAILKNRKMISALVWPLATTFGMVTQFKHFHRSNSEAAVFKNRKIAYLCSCLTDRHKIRHGDSVCPSWAFWSLKLRKFKNRRYGRTRNVSECLYSLDAWFDFIARHRVAISSSLPLCQQLLPTMVIRSRPVAYSGYKPTNHIATWVRRVRIRVSATLELGLVSLARICGWFGPDNWKAEVVRSMDQLFCNAIVREQLWTEM